MLNRDIQPLIEKHLHAHKILILNGPKNSGRTQLIRQTVNQGVQVRVFPMEDKTIRQRFEDFSPQLAQDIFASGQTCIIHEGQYLSNLQQWIEWVLFQDSNVNLVVINSFEPRLEETLMEALKQQDLVLQMAAPGFHELAQSEGLVNFEATLERRLIYGNLVDLGKSNVDIEQELLDRVETLLAEPLTRNERINKTDKLRRLLQFLAFYIGEQVSYHEIGLKCDLDNETVERYVRLLEKAYVLWVLPAFHSNQRYELKKTQHIYFHDNGIRNAMIRNFNPMDLRHDAEMLWKNWLISERMKRNMTLQIPIDAGFWATHTRQRVDFVERSGKHLWANQLLWDKKLRGNFPIAFTNYYPQATPFRITRANYWSFLKRD